VDGCVNRRHAAHTEQAFEPILSAKSLPQTPARTGFDGVGALHDPKVNSA
jgi:hypothetical protein